ncbi:uncharacterized protein LOC131642755, partial [Vicia villosa]|uniref:uncharacterized protein LOC131642755 n=1 Tax=Vicia villosa TaxID=3911 RepID=UPI00273B2DB2
MEEYFWREKSRVKWHSQGDRNTKFFHTYARIRRKTNTINSLVIDDSVISNQSLLENHIVEHFTNLFNQNYVLQENGLIRKVIPKLVNDPINDMLTMIPSEEEIHKAVLNLNVDSSPWPDGFGGIFFHKYLSIIKNDIVAAVIQFFTQGWMLPNYNANTLILIPKSNDASNIDRLASILPILISKEQKGFVAGRNIRDGVCITSEAINILQNKSFSGNAALKIDIAKAFDTLNWDFLIATLDSF